MAVIATLSADAAEVAQPIAAPPITCWWEAVTATRDTAAVAALCEIYWRSLPGQGEIIFTSACEFQCRHCIYPRDYSHFNPGLPAEVWVKSLVGLNQELGIKTFFYGGRAVTRVGVQTLGLLREHLPQARIGLIDNGISIIPYIAALKTTRLDWLDISLDGMAGDHDNQRGRQGSFAAALEGVIELRDSQLAPQLNILTCLTTLNYRSVPPMIRYLNTLGLKNFFITPVTIVDNVRPARNLAVSSDLLLAFLDGLDKLVGTLNDAYIEVGLFEVEHMGAICKEQPQRFAGFVSAEDHLAWTRKEHGNQYTIRYFPASLTGIREFIVNTNGDVIVTKSMSQGRVPKTSIFGNITRQPAGEIWANITRSAGFEMYEKELLKERTVFSHFQRRMAETMGFKLDSFYRQAVKVCRR